MALNEREKLDPRKCAIVVIIGKDRIMPKDYFIVYRDGDHMVGGASFIGDCPAEFAEAILEGLYMALHDLNKGNCGKNKPRIWR